MHSGLKEDEKKLRIRSDSEPASIAALRKGIDVKSGKTSKSHRPRAPTLDGLSEEEGLDDELGSHKQVSLKDYVASRGGKRVISKILIANNGIAALKCIRSIKKWCYDTLGSDKAIQFVAMATPEDIKANAAYIHMADEFVEVPGGPNNNNYANIHLIVETAERCGANAVWAGWGHASENPKLPEALAKSPHGIVWIGPPADAMRALGDKIGSTLIAQSAGVPCMPWSGMGLTVDYAKTGLPKEVYAKACVKTIDEAKTSAEKIGYPVMIKASEGGGGKGIRKVESPEALPMAFSQVQGEVPGSPIFLMKLAPVARHLEVQLLADEHGQAIAIFGRDCSIQRRHQKIIEEGPVVAAPPDVWRQMEKSAVRLAKEVGYTCAGTVEYLFTDNNEYCFLELNPRLQVEHPVTELISGVNLPAAQVQIAMGIPLYRLTGIRRLYGKHENGSSPITFDRADLPDPWGHVIACRVTAENPDREFQPTSGLIVELNFRSTPDVWGYFSVAAHGGVHEYSDSQFGHMFAKGETREIARRNMVLALKELSIRGDIRTTVEYLRQILETEDFKKNRVNTTWLEKVMAGKVVKMERPDPHVAVILGVVFRSTMWSRKSESEFLSVLERGHFPSEELYSSLVTTKMELIYENVKYVFTVHKSGPNSFDLVLNDWMTSVEVISLADDGMLVLLNGKKHVVYGQENPSGLRLTVDGQTVIFGLEYDPSQLKSTMAGKLVRYVVENGAHIEKDQPYAEVEVMKMYITLLVPESGYIELTKPEGAILEGGDLLAKLRLDHPERVKKAEVFEGSLPHYGPPHPISTKANQRLKDNLKPLKMLLAGYQLGPGVVQRALSGVMSALRDPSLPLSQFNLIMSTLVGRIPEGIYEELHEISRRYGQQLSENRFIWEPAPAFPAVAIEYAIENHSLGLTAGPANTLKSQLSPITSLIQSYSEGNHKYAVSVLTSLLEEYYEVETHFTDVGKLPEFIIGVLRKLYKNDLSVVARIARAHRQLEARNALVLSVLTLVSSELAPVSRDFRGVLQKLASLNGAAYAGVVLKARQLTIRHELPSSKQRRLTIQTILRTALEPGLGREEKLARLKPLIGQSQPLEDVIFTFFETKARLSSMEVYIRRIYQVYDIFDLKVEYDSKQEVLTGKWHFSKKLADEGSDEKRLNIEAAAKDKSPILKGKKKRTKTKGVKARSSESSSGAPESPEPPEPSPASRPTRIGLMAYFNDFDSLKKGFITVVRELADQAQKPIEPLNVLYLGFPWKVAMPSDDVISDYLATLVKSHQKHLQENFVKAVTFYLFRHKKEEYPRLFTFRARLDFNEDRVVRHIEPTNAQHMQLERLSLFSFEHTQSSNRLVHVFLAKPLVPLKTKKKGEYDGSRIFVRSIVRKLDLQIGSASERSQEVDLDAHPETEYAFVEALNSLEMAMAGDRLKWQFNFLFMNVLTEAEMDVAYIETVIRLLARRYRDKIVRLNISDVEFLVILKPKEEKEARTYHFHCTNPTGYVLHVDTYVEKRLPNGQKVFEYIGNQVPKESLPWHGKSVSTPYGLFGPFDRKRQACNELGTVYVYDFLSVLEHAIIKIWKKRSVAPRGVPSRTAKEGPHSDDDDDDAKKNRRSSQSDEAKAKARKLLASFSSENLHELHSDEDLDDLDEIDIAPAKKSRPEKKLSSQQMPPSAAIAVPNVVLKWKELVIDPEQKFSAWGEGKLKEVERPFGQNDVGMVAWLLTLYLPEYPDGRDIVLIANDITHQQGTFGPKEDHLFDLASKYARKRRIPRLYFAANSGARIGLADEVLSKFQIAWTNDDPFKGIAYIYLPPSDYEVLKKSVKCTPIQTASGELRYVITDIIGARDGIGVENLQGSAQIAGETSHAYDEIFTLTYVTGRTVGIGAYLARLGQRCIQKQTPPIILTGFNALNKLLGKHVYSSNVQLGGPEIMYTNGVTHVTVENDMQGVTACLNWLSYVPSQREGSVPKYISLWEDPIDRPVQFKPSKLPYDPRHLVAGVETDQGEWVSGFFDKDSFMEVLSGWARSVVVGRARLGGMPIGVIVVETRKIEQIIPADPANPDSKEIVLERAGQVWYPDSSFKTAQAIRDMVAEDLPLMIFANWRGFSGGMRDMFDEILKYGSYIVDSVRIYNKPIEVYIPPHGNLRGGAWVVVDSTINSKHMEMYAAPDSRGGVLEPEGTVDVKFRAPDQIAAAHRCDSILINLDRELAALYAKEKQKDKDQKDKDQKDKDQKSELVESKERTVEIVQKEIKARERKILPLYHQVASLFADLHDTPGRMVAKGVIKDVIPWETSRKFFYWRTKRRIVELDLVKRIEQYIPSEQKESALWFGVPLWQRATQLLHAWVKEAEPQNFDKIINDDSIFFEWVEANSRVLNKQIEKLQDAHLVEEVRSLAQKHPAGLASGLTQLLQNLDPEVRRGILEACK